MRLPSRVIIAGTEWKVIEQPRKSGGSFNTYDRVMQVGTEAKHHILGVFLHEVVESICTMRDIRYEGGRNDEDYLFSMDHKEFVHFCQDLEIALKDILRR